MKHILLVALLAAWMVGLFSPAVTIAQTRNVTFIVNTATAPDTVYPGYSVNLRGNKAPLDWGTNQTMTNVGGDYWSKTLAFTQGDTIRYKMFIGANGWEQGVVPDPPGLPGDPNRGYIVANRDTVLQVQFFNNGPVTNTQYFRPWTAIADSFINIYLRVNMQGADQNGTRGYVDATSGDSVGVRGGGPAGSDLDWGTTNFLKKEPAASNGGFAYESRFFKSGRIRIPKSRVNVGDTIQYKFVFEKNGTQWEDVTGGGNRKFKIPTGKKDSTIYYSYYQDVRPIGRPNTDTVIVVYNVNMTRALNSGGFATGDTVEVETGHFGTIVGSLRVKRLQQNIGPSYSARDTVVTSKGQTLDYQFYLNKNGVRTRENYYNYFFTGGIPSEAERRQVTNPTGPGQYLTLTVRDTGSTLTDARRMPDFPNPRKLLRNVTVTWEVDLRPAYYQVKLGRDTLTDIQGSFHVTNADSVFRWGVRINGPATNGWQTWGFPLLNDASRMMWDDGPAGGHGDSVLNDSIYTRIITTNPTWGPDSGSRSAVGQVFKFGIRGGDNEGGRGGFGNNHSANINDGGTTWTIADQWGSINPRFYNRWDYVNKRPILTGVEEIPGIAQEFALKQNYPNPFNPLTRIEYAIPTEGLVTLKVYNMLGQEVSTLVNEVQKAAKYQATFDAARFASGVYFYKLTTGKFTSTHKMMLLK